MPKTFPLGSTYTVEEVSNETQNDPTVTLEPFTTAKELGGCPEIVQLQLEI